MMSRIVQCPKCFAHLREPPPGNPYYQCGSCSTILQAKHATSAEVEASIQRMSTEQQKRNSFSDSSSGETSNRIGEAMTFIGNGDHSPRHKRRDVPTGILEWHSSSTEILADIGSYVRDGRIANQQQVQPVSFWKEQPDSKSPTDILMEKGSYLRAPLVETQKHSSVDEMQKAQIPHLYSHSGVSLQSSQAPIQNHLSVGVQRVYDSNSSNVHKPPIAAAGNLTSVPSRSKLRWQPRDPNAEVSASDAQLIGISENGQISEEDVKISVRVKEPKSAEQVVERNWRTLGSRRQSFEDRRPLDEKDEGELVRTVSVDSDKTFDMYDHPAFVGDYELSETSSSVDDAEHNQGIPSGPHSDEVGRYSPPLDQGITQSVSRPNLPCSNTSSGRSVFSEDSSSYTSQTEMGSPDNPLDHARRLIVAGRRHSWDERAPRMGSATSNTGQQVVPASVRQKSVSQDYGNNSADLVQRASSDTGWNYGSDQLQATQASLFESSRQSALRPSQQNYQQPQRWINRYSASPRSPAQQQWSPNISSRSVYVEPSRHPLQSKLDCPSRQTPGHGQLPPKQGHYPPLPPPGTLPHVLCQQCGIILAVPVNLPPPKNIQKLRCGSCRKISIFSVPQADESCSTPVFYTRFDSHLGRSLLVSRPDTQPEPPSVDCSPSTSSPISDTVLASNCSDVLSPQSNAEQQSRSTGLSSNSVYQKRGDSSSSHTKTAQGTNVGVEERVRYEVPNAAAEDRLPQDVFLTSSDSESDIIQQTVSATSSPQLNHIMSRSHSNSAPLPDLQYSARSVDHPADEQIHEAPRGLNKALKGIFSIKKSVLELTKSRQGHSASNYRRKVVVNGVAIPDHLVKRAEEQAGPIHPGTYWYDSQAGFWGVAGGQCIGIIPPFIEEFNFPMSRDCAGGRTGILVNGRELHWMDREKLSHRGLPETPGISYRIEIDGRVRDEMTGSELKPGLGRLAPTLEQVGCGAGMYIPANITGAGSRS